MRRLTYGQMVSLASSWGAELIAEALADGISAEEALVVMGMAHKLLQDAYPDQGRALRLTMEANALVDARAPVAQA